MKLLKERELYDEAVEDKKNNRNRSAIMKFTKVIEMKDGIKKTFSDIYFERAWCYDEIEEYEEAVVDLTKAIKLYPNCDSYFRNRGIAYHNMGENDKAREGYTQAIKILLSAESLNHESLKKNYCSRGNVYLLLREYEKALKDFEMYFLYGGSPGNLKAQIQLDRILANLNMNLVFANNETEEIIRWSKVYQRLGKQRGSLEHLVRGTMINETRFRKESEKLAKEKAKTENTEKIEFLKNLDSLDFEIQCKGKKSNTSVKLPKYLLSTYSCMHIKDKSFLNINNASCDNLFEIMFGIDVIETSKEKVNDIFNLFVICWELEMKNFMLVLCEKVKSLSTVEVIELFVLCYFDFEKDKKKTKVLDEDAEIDLLRKRLKKAGRKKKGKEKDSFSCCLSLALFNEMKRKKKKIMREKPLYETLEELKMTWKLKNHKRIDVRQHEAFKDHDNLISGIPTFQKVYKECVERLYSSRILNGSNLKLRISYYNSLPVHKEILIFNTNFFWRMLKFPGEESHQETIKIIGLSYKALEKVICHSYMIDYDKKNPDKPLKIRGFFQLLQHCEKYFEDDLMIDVIVKLNSKVKDLIKEREFDLKILECGYLLKEISDDLMCSILNSWRIRFPEVNRATIHEMIKYSKKTNDLANKYKEKNAKLMSQVGNLKRKRKEMEESCTCKNKRRKKGEEIACPVEGCEKTYKRVHNLVKHVKNCH